MRKLLEFIRPVNFFKRDSAFYKNYAAGTLTSRNLLEMEFGTFPIPDIAAEDINERPVSVKNPFQDKKSSLFGKMLSTVAALGYVHGKPSLLNAAGEKGEKDDAGGADNEQKFDRTIFLNHLIYSPVGQAAIGYIGATALKGAALAVAALQPLTFMLDRFLFFIMLPLSSIRTAHFTQLFSLPFRPAMDTVGHEHVHILQVHDKHERGTGFDCMNNYFKTGTLTALERQDGARRSFDQVMGLGLPGYFLNDYEIQARMHTALAHGFHRWGRLPQTKTEFYAAMLDCGLSAPDFIHRQVKESTEENVKDFTLTGAFNRAAKGLTRIEAAEINVAYRAQLRDDLRRAFWQTTLPYLYGHLLELYGDKMGRIKMGYTGPVIDNKGPAPLDLSARQSFLRGLTRWQVEEVKTHELARGIYIEDENFDLPGHIRREMTKRGTAIAPHIAPRPLPADFSPYSPLSSALFDLERAAP